MEIIQTFDCNVVECGNKHYVNVTNVCSTIKSFEDYFLKLDSDTAYPMFTNMINRFVGANRRQIFTENEPSFKTVLGGAGHGFFTPIFNKFPIEELLQKDCE